jgi:chromosome segregation ATPase
MSSLEEAKAWADKAIRGNLPHNPASITPHLRALLDGLAALEKAARDYPAAISEYRAHIAAQSKEIEALKREVAWQKERCENNTLAQSKEIEALKERCKRRRTRIAILEEKYRIACEDTQDERARLAKAEEALEFYAHAPCVDEGQQARAALRAIREGCDGPSAIEQEATDE